MNPSPILTRGLALLLALTIPFPSVAAESALTSCQCLQEPSGDALALFEAVERMDEAAFMRLLQQVPDAGSYAVYGRSLVDMLLQPSRTLLKAGEYPYGWLDLSKVRKEEILAQHAAMLPAKKRMLEALLSRGVTARQGGGELPPLLQAAAWGNADIVRLLLGHGADASQSDPKFGLEALAFALNGNVRAYGNGWRALLEPASRADIMLTLLDAGARPQIDEFDGEPEAAQAWWWSGLAARTGGAAILRRFADLVPPPVADPRPLEFAAQAGNLEALRWLLPHTKRMGPDGEDVWAGAAVLSLYPYSADRGIRDAALPLLLDRATPWAQRLKGRDNLYQFLDENMPQYAVEEPSGGILSHLVAEDAGAWVDRAVAMGARVDGDEGDAGAPLARAAADGNAAMVKRLLRLGASPLAGSELRESAFYQALDAASGKDLKLWLLPGRQEALLAMLEALSAEQKAMLLAAEPSPAEVLLQGREQGAVLLKAFYQSGLSKSVSGAALLDGALRSNDQALPAWLLKQGVSARQSTEQDGDPLLLSALIQRREDLIGPLLDAGADPNRVNRYGKSALQHAIRHDMMPQLELLLARGGRLGDVYAGDPALIELAAVSNSEAMLARILPPGDDLAGVCFEEDDRWYGMAMEASDDQWRRLLALGLGKAAPVSCGGDPAGLRLVRSVLAGDSHYAVGWRAERFKARLRDWQAQAPMSNAQGQALADEAGRMRRDDVSAALEDIGFHAQRRDEAPWPGLTVNQRRKMKDFAGAYYLEGDGAGKSRMVLQANGRFDWGIVRGGAGQKTQGDWRWQSGELQFRSDPAKANAKPPFKWGERPSSNDAPAPLLHVRVLANGRNQPGVKVSAIGCEAPLAVDGQTGGDGWLSYAMGDICQIALSHPGVRGNQRFVFDIPGSVRKDGRREYVFELAVDENDLLTPFRENMKARRGELLWMRDGQSLRYVRE
ncbi:ankyrin repeat domain-containing protein [Chromobacterium vaccinii]|uniref:Ankyrin repeat domain-containing protein n=1 Tax=Chromobacterium vaccinii TaxID=1108595 RepID=A0ABV0FIN0_9NEIS